MTLKKLLGRRLCPNCGGSFNVADVQDSEYSMPAILPNPQTCSIGPNNCTNMRNLVTRSDDTETTIRARFRVFDEETRPVTEFYDERKKLTEFHVKKGISDIDRLVEIMSLAK